MSDQFITNYPVTLAFIAGLVIGYLLGQRNLIVFKRAFSIPFNIGLYIINIILLLIGISNQVILFIYIVLDIIDILQNVYNVFVCDIKTRFKERREARQKQFQ